MKKLSVAIAARNEENNIADCLASVKWADEVVLFDENSSDGTVAIAKKFTDKVFITEHQEMFHRTKQKAVDACSGEWILQLDADEVVTADLEQEIRKVISGNGQSFGYQIPRKNYIFGKWIEHSGWYPDYQIKLFKKGKGKYPCKSVHEQIEIVGNPGVLKSDLVHNHYSSVFQYVDRLNRYTTDDARYLKEKGERVVWSDAIKFPTDEFFKRFFFWEGYLDGLHGLVLSLLQASNRLIVFAKLWEMQGFTAYDSGDFMDQITIEAKKTAHDFRYWLMVKSTNPLKKLYYKLRNKLPLL